MKRYVKLLWFAIPLLIVAFAVASGGVGEAAWLGMTVETASKATATAMGVPVNVGRVVVVQTEAPALSAGVIAGDFVLGINGRPVESVGNFLAAARDIMKTRGPNGLLPDVVLTMNREGQPLVITVPSEWVEAKARR
ncbi:MAG: hypothetical protein GY854_24085 [Deltaproteobacteria bacterium]|nr:hypothetical protein [Deltaproteobacteria bacterium]